MVKQVTLNKRYKEVIFAMSGLGPNLLMTLMMAYFSDAVIPSAMQNSPEFWTFSGSKVAIVSVIIFPILWMIGRFFDGIIDVPLATLTDTLKNKTGKKYLAILISFAPMIISFILCWIPICGKGDNLTPTQLIGNSIWIFFWSIVFFASYTLGLITFYGSLSSVCSNQTQRARVSAYKSVFDTISYALVYAAIPAIFSAVNVPIYKVAIYLSPLMLTILIPLSMRNKNNEEMNINKDANVPIGKSILLTIKSKPFMKWLLINCISFFGLQMFLTSQNALISGIMNLNATQAAILNTCAFAPVPLMLYFFNRFRKKCGIRTAYQTCLISFGIAIVSFNLGSQYIWGDNLAPKLIIGAVGGVIGSWGIGGFFMVPYLIPTVVASVEEEVTGKNHSAMYFAVQALATSAVGAISSVLIYDYLKQWTKDAPNVSSNINFNEWACGASLVPLIVLIACFAGFFLCFLMPKKYTAKVIFNDVQSSAVKEKNALIKKKEKLISAFNKQKEEINTSSITSKDKEILINDLKNKLDFKIAKINLNIHREEQVINFKFDINKSSANEETLTIYEYSNVLADTCLYFLSGFIFAIVDYIIQYKKYLALGISFTNKEKILIILGLIIPFVSIYSNQITLNKLEAYINNNHYNLKINKNISVITSVFLPMFLNVIDLTFKNIYLNKILDSIN